MYFDGAVVVGHHLFRLDLTLQIFDLLFQCIDLGHLFVLESYQISIGVLSHFQLALYTYVRLFHFCCDFDFHFFAFVLYDLFN